MIENEYNGDSYNKGSDSLTRGIKSSHFENQATFERNFTRYNPKTSNFIPGKNAHFTTQYGGIPVGSCDGDVLVDSSDAHTVVLGATGSKKSRLVIMPSVRVIADAGESMIISDPKAEIYNRTAGYLQSKGYHIEVINLRNPSIGSTWNPLYIPYTYYKEGNVDKAYEFANDIAVNLALSEIAVKDPYWDYSARDLFFGLELLLFRVCQYLDTEINAPNIANLLLLRKYLFKNYHKNSAMYDKSSILRHFMKDDFITSSALMGTVSAPENTQASILSVFDEKMRCFTIQPDLLNMLSSNSINIEKLMDRKSAVFIIMPDEKTTYHKLVSLFIKQSYEYIIYQAQQRETNSSSIRINYILDEFASLPAIKDFPSMISAARSRNIRFMLVVQSKHQLIEKYENEADTIKSNCSNWIFLTSREIELLHEISLLCGKKGGSGRELVPLDALQHFNKEKGEALVLSDRLFPYITRLYDIKKYDGDILKDPPSQSTIKIINNNMDFETIDKTPIEKLRDKGEDKKVGKSVEVDQSRHELLSSHNKTEEILELMKRRNELRNIQSEIDRKAEMDRKIDELFGEDDE